MPPSEITPSLVTLLHMNKSYGLNSSNARPWDLDIWYYMSYNWTMKESRRKPNTSIRIDREVLRQARIAAVTQKKTLGQWLEEAILEKVGRQRPSDDWVSAESPAKD